MAKVGRDLYEQFFRGYTRKQWERDPSELHASVCARIPVRTNTDDRYFTDRFQQMPADGYTAMFERILDHPNIAVSTGTDYDEVGASMPTPTGLDRSDRRVLRLPVRRGCPTARSIRAARHGDARAAACPADRVDQLPEPGMPYTRITEFRT